MWKCMWPRKKETDKEEKEAITTQSTNEENNQDSQQTRGRGRGDNSRNVANVVKEKANYVDEEVEPTFLLADKGKRGEEDMWYFDTNASNHTGGNKEKFVDLDELVNGKVTFGDLSQILIYTESLKLKTTRAFLVIAQESGPQRSQISDDDQSKKDIPSGSASNIGDDQSKNDIPSDFDLHLPAPPQVVEPKQLHSASIERDPRLHIQIHEYPVNQRDGDFTGQDVKTLKFQLMHYQLDVPSDPEFQNISSFTDLCRELVPTPLTIPESAFASGYDIKALRFDIGGEFTSNYFKKICEENRIHHPLTVSRSLQQNRVAEKKNKTILNMARSKTLQEAWSERKPSVSHLWVFGSIAHVNVSDERRTKLDNKNEKLVFIGFKIQRLQIV
ncbi:uncharacterized protein LOC132277601 [Cornus florida]|uniref:uncharacterized protein LOC132277601 n=1 Tax=Cornus florida TaxID=4283 RepID=UPI00289CFED6|nr:uncharacterized protein LOC132277601 [Cornus florida]